MKTRVQVPGRDKELHFPAHKVSNLRAARRSGAGNQEQPNPIPADNSPEGVTQRRLQAIADAGSTNRPENRTGLPDSLKAGVESLSGLSLDDVTVHYNSAGPARLQALAYTQGADIHVGPGQERHLAHEAWHVAQQKQGRVRPTARAAGTPINEDTSLEREADVMGARALQRKTYQGRIARSTTVQAQVQADHGGLSSTRRGPVTQLQDPWDPAANALEVAEENAQNARIVPTPHPVSIGPQQQPGPPPTTTGTQRHFDDDMRREVSNVLNYLPAEHIVGNPALTRVVMEHATPANPGISNFGGNQLHVLVPFDASSWIYLSMSKWPVGDLATTLMTNMGYAANNPNLGEKKTEVFNRDVVGTGSISNKIAMMGENFVEWLLKHETGHSVDEAIGYTTNQHYRLPALGGWLIHDGTDTNLPVMGARMLTALGLVPLVPALDAAFQAHTGNTFTNMFNAATNNHDPNAFSVPHKDAARTAFEQGGTPDPAGGVFGPVVNGLWKAQHLEDVVLEGLDSPWQKGGKGGIPLANRTYHVEYQHTRWVSYNSEKYSDRNSNYQYSGPEEWFGETYARYFSHRTLRPRFWQPVARDWGSKLKDADARDWFRTNLDPINGPGNLIVGNVLQNIPGPAPAMPVQGPVNVPTLWERVRGAVGNLVVNVAKITGSAIFRVLSTAFLLPVGILKYLVWVPLKWLWRTLLGFF